MDNVLTLITHPDNRLLSSSEVNNARKAMEDLGAESSGPDWLSDGEACDITFDMLPVPSAEAAVRQALNNLPIDVIAQSTAQRKKKLIIADMDSTIVNGETLDDLAEFAGVKDEIAAITARAMEGDLDFFEALRERVAMLTDLSEQFLAETMDEVQLNPGAKELIRTMKANGAFAALISGGFSYFTDRVRQDVGFDMSLGNVLDIQDGKLTGKVVPPVVTKDTKLEMLIDMAAQQELGMSNTMAIGDGANDVPMLRAAGTGIAYHGHKVARETADARIDHATLSAALFIQGYRRDEFVE